VLRAARSAKAVWAPPRFGEGRRRAAAADHRRPRGEAIAEPLHAVEGHATILIFELQTGESLVTDRRSAQARPR
jgi:hypothetical protein